MRALFAALLLTSGCLNDALDHPTSSTYPGYDFASSPYDFAGVGSPDLSSPSNGSCSASSQCKGEACCVVVTDENFSGITETTSCQATCPASASLATETLQAQACTSSADCVGYVGTISELDETLPFDQCCSGGGSVSFCAPIELSEFDPDVDCSSGGGSGSGATCSTAADCPNSICCLSITESGNMLSAQGTCEMSCPGAVKIPDPFDATIQSKPCNSDNDCTGYNGTDDGQPMSFNQCCITQSALMFCGNNQFSAGVAAFVSCM